MFRFAAFDRYSEERQHNEEDTASNVSLSPPLPQKPDECNKAAHCLQLMGMPDWRKLMKPEAATTL